MQGQLTEEATNTLDLDTLEDDQREYRQGHAQGSVDVGGRDDLHVFDAGHVEQLRQEVDGDQVHEVHQEDPAEDGQRQRCNDLVAAVEGFLDALINELDHQLNEVLQATWDAGRGLLGRHAEQEQEQRTEENGPAHGINVDSHEAHVGRFLSAMSHGPGVLGQNGTIGTFVTGREFPVGQVLKVVLDVI